MKDNIILIILLFLGVPTFSQTIIVDDNVNLKKGIYKDFDEFKFNTPSLPLVYQFDTVEYKNIDIDNNEIKHLVFRLKIDISSAKQMGSIFGFCDGKHVFINEYQSETSNKLDFELLQFVGLYSFFETYMFLPGELGSANSGLIIGKALNINNGDIITLSKNVINTIFENDSVLLKQFDREKDKKLKIKDFVALYSLKHKIDGIYCRDKKMTITEADSFIVRKSGDITDQVYYNRLLSKLKTNPAFSDASLDETFYEKGQRKSIGINTRKNFDPNDHFLGCVGLWKFYYDNGQLKEEIFYSIMSKQIGRKRYNKDGTLILK